MSAEAASGSAELAAAPNSIVLLKTQSDWFLT
jgi:hypothetical protein